MIGDAGGVHVAQPARQLGVGPGIGELDAALLIPNLTTGRQTVRFVHARTARPSGHRQP
jgi:hypothetical protein